MAGNSPFGSGKEYFPRAGESNCQTGSRHYRDDIHEVVFPQGVQNSGDGVFRDCHPQPLHAAAHVHQDHYVLGRGGCLDVPLAEREEIGRRPRLVLPPGWEPPVEFI